MMLVIGVLLGAGVTILCGALWLRFQVISPLDRVLGKPASAALDLSPSQRIADIGRQQAVRDAAQTTQQERAGRIREALVRLDQGVVIWDADGEESMRNELAADYLADPFTGALLRPHIDELLNRALRGAPVDEEVDIFGPPARSFFVHAQPLTATDAAGVTQPIGAMAVIEDVSEIQRLHGMRRDFVANLSHELRTPIGAISLLSETVSMETDPEVVERLTGRLVDESTRLATVIDELLALSHIEHDQQPPHEPVAVQALVQDALNRVEVAADAAGLQMQANLPGEPLVMDGDQQQLLSAITNLLENAIKYSNRGGSVTVAASRVDGAVEISVADSGIGIPASDQERIFERFYRVDRSRRSGSGGTGLGLSIVRHVALNHGGTVSVTSIEGEGSTFTLTLPQSG